MLSRRVILCPVDFSEQSQHALRWAQALAARYQSRLIVLTVIDPLLANTARMRLGVDLAETETRPSLREFVKTAWPGGPVTANEVVLDVRIGDAPQVIVETAAEHAADLIVLGTHGMGGFRKWLLGSTTQRVLSHANTPVLGVPPGSGEPGVSLPNNAMTPNVRVLAATDLRESSVAAVAWASQLAEESQLPLLVAHIVEPIAVAPQWQSYVEESTEGRVAAAREQLERLALRLCGGRPCEAIVQVGRPEEALTAIAKERGADLIVMGLTGEHDSAPRRPGSIAYGVLRAASVPVLVVPTSSHVSV
jgi:nucleotide-binding universal stress UspA family protein